jgi:hypothetical protein
MPELLAKVPDEVRPRPDPDWYKFDHGKFLAWWKAQLVGMTIDESLPLEVRVERVGGRTDRPWLVTGYLGGKRFSSFGTEHSWSTSFPGYYVNETSARKWSDFKAGTRVRVKGTISDVIIRSESQSGSPLLRYHLLLVLRDIEPIVP